MLQINTYLLTICTFPVFNVSLLKWMNEFTVLVLLDGLLIMCEGREREREREEGMEGGRLKVCTLSCSNTVH